MGEVPALRHHPGVFLEASELDPTDFSSTSDSNLTDWIRLVHIGHRDAVVSVRTDEGKEGTLWCQQGDIIDAACDGLAGEDAVYRALSWREGSVSVDFRVVSHQRLIQTATSGLLLEAANREDSGSHGLAARQRDLPQGAPLADLETAGTTTATLRTQRFPWNSRQPTALLLLAVAGAIMLLALLAGVLWKRAYPARPRSTAAATPAREFSVRTEPEPARVAILLEGEQAAAPPRRPLTLPSRKTGRVTIREISETETLFTRRLTPEPPAPATVDVPMVE